MSRKSFSDMTRSGQTKRIKKSVELNDETRNVNREEAICNSGELKDIAFHTAKSSNEIGENENGCTSTSLDQESVPDEERAWHSIIDEPPLSDESDDEFENFLPTLTENEKLRDDLKNWAVRFRISHVAVIKMYAIVKFLDENDAPGIVCQQWINFQENKCVYPNVRTNEARDKLLRRRAEPEKNWVSCRIKILHKYSSFSEALQHLQQAEETSNLESEDEFPCNRPRKRKRDNFMYPGEESEEDYTTPTPSQNKELPYPVPPSHLIYSPPHERNDLCSPTNSIPRSPTRPEERGMQPLYFSKAHDTQGGPRPPSAPYQTIINGKVMAWMADISAKVLQVDNKLELILGKLSQLQPDRIEDGNENIEILGSLPVKDDASFMELDRKTTEERSLRQLLVKVLISVGGKDMRSHIYNMLRRVLTDEVAELYSLSGKSTSKNATKKPFLSTGLSRSIFSACQKIHKDQATEVQIKEVIGDWLNQAKVRKLRRMQRHEKQMEKNAESLQLD